MFARFQQVKAGATIDPASGESLSNVEKSLKSLGIEIRNQTDGNFRPFGDVIDELSKKWNTLGNAQQSEVAGALAGLRQRENFLALMANYNKALEYQTGLENSAGKSTEAYGKYLEGAEAVQNKFTSTWQELWTKTINSDAIINTLKLGTAIVQLVIDMGGLIPVVIALVGAIVLFRNAQIATFLITAQNTFYKPYAISFRSNLLRCHKNNRGFQ